MRVFQVRGGTGAPPLDCSPRSSLLTGFPSKGNVIAGQGDEGSCSGYVNLCWPRWDGYFWPHFSRAEWAFVHVDSVQDHWSGPVSGAWLFVGVSCRAVGCGAQAGACAWSFSRVRFRAVATAYGSVFALSGAAGFTKSVPSTRSPTPVVTNMSARLKVGNQPVWR